MYRLVEFYNGVQVSGSSVDVSVTSTGEIDRLGGVLSEVIKQISFTAYIISSINIIGIVGIFILQSFSDRHRSQLELPDLYAKHFDNTPFYFSLSVYLFILSICR